MPKARQHNVSTFFWFYDNSFDIVIEHNKQSDMNKRYKLHENNKKEKYDAVNKRERGNTACAHENVH